MPRARKAGLDYFPLDVRLDDEVELVEAKHGLEGFGIIIKLYQDIYFNGYYLNVNAERLLLFKKRINVDINTINAVINDAIKWGLFDQKLYETEGILTSRGIQTRYVEATRRRTRVEMDERYLLLEQSDDIIPQNVYINPLNVDVGTQSKVKKRKEENSKEKKKGKISRFVDHFTSRMPPKWEGPISAKAIEFIYYRKEQFPPAKQYKSTKGIDGLIRHVKKCQDSGLDVIDCLDETMERGWLTPDPKYFDAPKAKPLVGASGSFEGKKYEGTPIEDIPWMQEKTQAN